MSGSKIAVFSDFDGTISRRDVGNRLFHHFSGGQTDSVVADWKAKEITSRECLRREAELISPTAQELYAYLDDFEIDSGFAGFVKLCQSNGVELTIASDGLDIYINYLLKQHRLNDLKLISNHAVIEDRRMTIEFPVSNKTCKRCGVCKGELLVRYRESCKGECRIVFVGDGYSDACAAGEADFLFAKKDLEQVCLTRNICYYAFDTFDDVTRKLIELELVRK